MRTGGQSQGLSAMMSGGAMTPVVLPAEDIRELVAQALAKKKGE